MKIDDKIIEQVKRVPIEKVLHTVKFKRVGNRLMARCPLHSENQASFAVYPGNTWFCFGGCHDGGDTIKLIQKLCDVSFTDAVEYLKKYV